jgi:hypothetical protein
VRQRARLKLVAESRKVSVTWKTDQSVLASPFRSWSLATRKNTPLLGRKAAPAGGPIGTKSGGPIPTKSGWSNQRKSCTPHHLAMAAAKVRLKIRTKTGTLKKVARQKREKS